MEVKMGTKAKDVYVTQFSDRLAPGGRFPFCALPCYTSFISQYASNETFHGERFLVRASRSSCSSCQKFASAQRVRPFVLSLRRREQTTFSSTLETSTWDGTENRLPILYRFAKSCEIGGRRLSCRDSRRSHLSVLARQLTAQFVRESVVFVRCVRRGSAR